jgi:hypothetical protein
MDDRMEFDLVKAIIRTPHALRQRDSLGHFASAERKAG